MLKLLTSNDNGLFKTIKNSRGKEKQELAWESCILVNEKTGEIISKSIAPVFDHFTYEDYRRVFKLNKERGRIPAVRFIEPMFAFEAEEYTDLDNTIAELKMDGHRCLLYIGELRNRAFSRRISKITGWFAENTDQIPHIRDISFPEYEGTVLDGEIVWGKDSRECQSVMGALPQTAIQKQWKTNKWAIFYVFDILFYKGIKVTALPLWRRKMLLAEVVEAFVEKYEIDYIQTLPILASESTQKKLLSLVKDNPIRKHIHLILSIEEEFQRVVKEGKEGLIVKNIYGKYRFGKRSRDFLKLKKQSTWDCVFMGLTEPTVEYTGKLIEEGRLDEWRYWYDPEQDCVVVLDEGEKAGKNILDVCNPITKPYAMGWCGGIRFGVYKTVTYEEIVEEYGEQRIKIMLDNGEIESVDSENLTFRMLVEVGVAKGLTEEVMEDLKQNGEKYAREKRVIEVMAQEVIDKEKGTLRHPRFFSFRDDKNHLDCTWENHIR